MVRLLTHPILTADFGGHHSRLGEVIRHAVHRPHDLVRVYLCATSYAGRVLELDKTFEDGGKREVLKETAVSTSRWNV
jgi:hypothetical protein